MGDVNAGSGGSSFFPNTPWSAIVGARAPDDPSHRECLERLCRSYWKPILSYFLVSRRCRIEEAEDLAQGFFARLLQSPLIERADRARGRFRVYLKTALRNFASDVAESARSIKRGGGMKFVSLDAEEAVLMQTVADSQQLTPESVLDRRWVQEVVARALPVLERSLATTGHEAGYRMFVRRYGGAASEEERITYKKLAGEFGLSLFDVVHHLERARERFREIVMEILRETVADETAAAEEFEELFGGKG